ncbi:cholecystokinin receptor type A-like [Haliotis asinina]|uniref:cholecystokinin receptor type A-like n=1 Tax=Haliotis asinina TaxID=109174 RepID=UPI0035319923
MSNLSSDTNTTDTGETAEVSKSAQHAVICILMVLSVFGSIGNGLVLYVFSKKVDKVTSTIFILALAGADFVTSLVIMPFTAVNILLDEWLIYDFICKLYQFFITCNVPLSSFLMVAIAVDRYLCICHPFVRAMTPARARMSILCLSLFAFLLGSITSLAYGVVKPQVVSTSASNNTNTSEVTSDAFTGSDDNSTTTEVTEYVYTGKCSPNMIILSRDFLMNYQKVYASFFLISVVIVSILYGLIYYSVTQRRKWRWRQKSLKPSMKSMTTCHTDVETVELHKTDKNGVNAEDDPEEKQQLNHRKRPSGRDKKDYNRLANIRTAAMLFVVTTVFIIAFLPAWLMAHRLIGYNIVVFYMYFVYSVANPVIYAFMNVAFRKELKEVFTKGSSCTR